MPGTRSGRAAGLAGEAVHHVHDVVHDAVHELGAALKPRLRGVLHELAFAISLVTGTVLVCLADGPRARTSASVYAASVALLFGTSAAYHRGTWGPKMQGLMARLDHSMIFILIAGTYTPFALLLLDGSQRWLLVGLYLLLGWVALGFLPSLLHRGGVAVVALLLAGGALYSVGAVVYALRRPNPSPRWFGFHEVFHALTLAAFVTHYVAVSLATYRNPA